MQRLYNFSYIMSSIQRKIPNISVKTEPNDWKPRGKIDRINWLKGDPYTGVTRHGFSTNCPKYLNQYFTRKREYFNGQ